MRALRLDVPGALPRAERPLSSDQGKHDVLQLDDQPYLLRQGQARVPAMERGLPFPESPEESVGG